MFQVQSFASELCSTAAINGEAYLQLLNFIIVYLLSSDLDALVRHAFICFNSESVSHTRTGGYAIKMVYVSWISVVCSFLMILQFLVVFWLELWRIWPGFFYLVGAWLNWDGADWGRVFEAGGRVAARRWGSLRVAYGAVGGFVVLRHRS